jgi:hypothetical protein
MFEEPTMRAWHVLSHFMDEVMACFGHRTILTSSIGIIASGTRWAMFHAQHDVKELDNRALCVASTAVLSVILFSTSIVVEQTFGESSILHVPAASKEWPDPVVKDMRITVLVHSMKKSTDLIQDLREVLKTLNDNTSIPFPSGRNCLHHQGNTRCRASLNGHRD